MGRKGIRPVKKLEWWGTGMVICLERDADLHMAQLMPLPLTISCFSKIQIGFTFLVPADPGSPGKWAVKRVCVCVLFRRDLASADAVLLLTLFTQLLTEVCLCCTEVLRTHKLSHRSVHIQPRGLTNRANWCYVNAVSSVQCMLP